MKIVNSGETDCCYKFGQTTIEEEFMVFSNTGTRTFNSYLAAFEYGKIQYKKTKAPVNIVQYIGFKRHICDIV